MEIIRKEEVQTLTIRLFSPAIKLPEVLGGIYGEIAGLVTQKGLSFTGAPFVLYRNMDMENLDIEAGFPVAGTLEAAGRVKPSKLPSGEMATALHTGSYDSMEGTYNALTAFVKDKGRETEDFMYEEYLNSPDEVKKEELQTKIYFYLK
ncbi:MAG: GyrI-like domain-containing protein [Spirochaetales bacterium]|nr:GyrI-like domain-containing protein [Spirochaetales bacterium]